MYIIVGLGNPGKEYENTRHNVGFMLIDKLASKYGIAVSSKEHKALTGKGVIDGQKVVLCKPQTYMNLSGESVRSIADYYKVDPESEIIVISDDIDLPPGYIRVRPKGSAGGHNGLKNIILHLGTDRFRRIRMGVGAKNEHMDLKDHVLGHFSKDDLVELEQSFSQAEEAIKLLLFDDVDKAMNLYNKKVVKKSEQEA